MRPLTDREMFMLLAAAPVDEAARGRTGTAARAGHVTLFERAQATRLARDGSPTGAEAVDARWGRATFARVFGLPARAPDADEPIVFDLVWKSDADNEDAATEELFERGAREAQQILRALDTCGTPTTRTSMVERIEALAAEVLELRARQEGR